MHITSYAVAKIIINYKAHSKNAMHAEKFNDFSLHISQVPFVLNIICARIIEDIFERTIQMKNHSKMNFKNA